MNVPFVLPALLADPPPASGSTWLIDATLFDGTGAPPSSGVSVAIEDGRISGIFSAPVQPDPTARVIDLGGRFLMPGIVDCHAHLSAAAEATPRGGAEPLLPGVSGHFVAAAMQKALGMGITTIRDTGAFGDVVLEARQAMRYGAFRGSRVLVCGRIVSATSAGGRQFEGMYREADGPEEMRKAAREQLRRGADYVKIMMTGARSVELENPAPAQVTMQEATALVDEVHRQGYRVAAHCEGLEGTRLAIESGVDTVEHGFYLHREPELLEQMARRGIVLVPTLSYLEDIAQRKAGTWSPHLVERGRFNLEEGHKTLAAAISAGVLIGMGFDSTPEEGASAELGLMVRAGMSQHDALVAATSTGAKALGLEDLIGTVEPGKSADLLVVDGDPLEDMAVLAEPGRIHLVLQGGKIIGGARPTPAA